jgi:hypothetical protein
MIPMKHKWRKQVMLSMNAGDLKLLDELVDLDYRAWGGRKNRSRTVAELVRKEHKRRKKEAEAIKA